MTRMHSTTFEDLRARLLTELTDAATAPRYAGLGLADFGLTGTGQAAPASPGSIAALEGLAVLLNEPVVVAAAPVYQDVPVSTVEGYMRLRTHIARLTRWVAATPLDQDDANNGPRDFAAELLDMMAGGNVGVFQTSVPAKRAAILGAFGSLAALGAGGFSAQSIADLEAMTIAPSTPPETAPHRWQWVIDGLSGVPGPPGQRGLPGPPNVADVDLLAELLA